MAQNCNKRGARMGLHRVLSQALSAARDTIQGVEVAVLGFSQRSLGRLGALWATHPSRARPFLALAEIFPVVCRRNDNDGSWTKNRFCS